MDLIELLAMPVLYATLDLPKTIINEAIDGEQFPIDVFGEGLSQVEYFFLLCSFFLLMATLNSGLKHVVNIYKGRVAESPLRPTMRMAIPGTTRISSCSTTPSWGACRRTGTLQECHARFRREPVR